MPKAKQPVKRKTKPSKPAAKKKITKPRVARPAQPAREPAYSPEYRDYLERYELAGADRPRLSPKDFDRLDDELLDLLALDLEMGLDDEQTIRLRELEYLLLDAEQ
ncbi:MAG: hypothetical protein FJ009_06475 [Chloroflexi bacterium]|nr:hypothetical protein [Chloroflexota bacterium]